MNINGIINGFSKMSKEEKLKLVAGLFDHPEKVLKELKSYWHRDPKKQTLFDEFSENTLSNFYFPFGIAPNFLINNKNYMVPMVIEESSVIAAASSSAKFWAERGGFHAEVVSSEKLGQVHFVWKGDPEKLKQAMPALKQELLAGTKAITANMESRGGGILDVELINMNDRIEDYYQLKVSFETVDSMGANFINSVLEEFARILKEFLVKSPVFNEDEKDCEIIMSILSNYTPDCLVRAWVECDISRMHLGENDMNEEKFVWKFQKAIEIAKVDKYRATTHNKGIFNGIDALALATGNDFRAIEAGAHTYACRTGKYQSLTELTLDNGMFHYELKVPLAMGTVGGLTSLHPMARFSLEMLGKPSARELMIIAACAGLANNFGAVKSLVTKGIQVGHMKMHLFNILNFYAATQEEKLKAVEYFKNKKVSFKSVTDFINNHRSQILGVKS
ncbi:MAG TPA: hydroxymethylglutaryl-CoA reductase, degradative [Bacteroidales bacterium]|nr:hydroxymethylglutaryl-CoA reductase, degradative [Bacteroidales bacterium]